ncbi:MAG: hypothetical protein JWM62_1528, partial [Frankiales bacterium]|nr:hypothetical protein [Frankiales bacterium]
LPPAVAPSRTTAPSAQASAGPTPRASVGPSATAAASASPSATAVVTQAPRSMDEPTTRDEDGSPLVGVLLGVALVAGLGAAAAFQARRR